MIDRYLQQNLVQLREKGFKPLTCGFGDHCYTIIIILLKKNNSWYMEFSPICVYLLISLLLSLILSGVVF